MNRRRRRRRGQPNRGPALAGLLVAAGGAIAVGLSLLLSSGASTAASTSDTALLTVDGGGPAQARRASELPAEELEPTPPVVQKAVAAPPQIRAVAPKDARPVDQARAVGARPVGPSAPNTTSAVSAITNAPFSVVVTPGDGAPPGVFDLASGIVKRLTGAGITAKLSTLADAGRPDAIIIVGTKQQGTAESWYCDPGPPQGVALAKLLDNSIRSGPTTPAPGDDAPQSRLPCDDLQAGRARVAAALLELPDATLKRPDLSDHVSDALRLYFNQNASAVRSARTAARLVWPATGPITSPYGPAHPLGIDIGESVGNIVAATDGIVTFSGGNPCCSYGLYVMIHSPDGIRTVYGHLSTLAVRKGQKVSQGQVLGKVGCTGNCTGPHLHFEVIDRGVRQNPMKYLP